MYTSDIETTNTTGNETMTKTISPIEMITGSRDAYQAVTRDAVRLPIPGVVRWFHVVDYDDFGNKITAIISSTEWPNSDGSVSWTRAEVS